MYIHIVRKKLNSPIELSTYGEIISNFKKNGYIPILQNAKENFVSNLGINEPLDFKETFLILQPTFLTGELGITAGDIFITPDNSLIYLKVITDSKIFQERYKGTNIGIIDENLNEYIEIGEMKVTKEPSVYIEKFCKLISEILNLNESDWVEILTPNDKLVKLLSENIIKSPSEYDVKVNSVIEEPICEDILTSLNTKKELSFREILQEVKEVEEEENIKYIISELVSLGIIKKEYIIRCRKTNQLVNRLKDFSGIELLDKAGIRCFCGNLLSEEVMEDYFSLTEYGYKIASGSCWLTRLLLEELLEYSMTNEMIKLYYNLEEDEIEVFVNFDNNILIFHLKNGEYNINYAKKFAELLIKSEADKGIIISSQGITDEAQEYLDNIAKKSPLIYINKLDDIRHYLNEIFEGIRRETISTLLQDYAFLSAIDISSGILKKFSSPS